MNMLLKYTILAFVAFSLLSCGEGNIDSEDLKTSGIHATVRIYAEENETLVDARLTAGGANGSDVKLSSSDDFTVSAFSETKTLVRENRLLGAYDTYAAEFGSNESNALISLRLTRENDLDATNNYVNLPPKINVSPRISGETVSPDEIVILEWEDNSSGLISVQTQISCKSTDGENIIGYGGDNASVDDGAFSVIFGQLLTAEERRLVDTSIACSGSFSLERETTGTLDSNLDGGNIKSYQTATRRYIVLF
jgi:hypothetical protein